MDNNIIKTARMKADLYKKLKDIDRTPEWILSQDGFRDDELGEKRDYATEALLKAIVPVELHAEKGIILKGLNDGILTVAISGLYDDEDLVKIKNALIGLGLIVKEIDEPLYITTADYNNELLKTKRVTKQIINKSVDSILADNTDGEAVSSLVNDLIVEALENGASDLHIYYVPNSFDCFVFHRKMGKRQPAHLFPPEVMKSVVNRIKQAGNVSDYTRREIMQDGRLTIEWQGRNIDARLATKPIEPGGEALTIRLLDRAQLKPLSSLLASMPKVAKKLKKIFDPPVKTSGLIIVCGAMGSGKTTTLTAMLNSINRISYAVTEIATPIEYLTPHVRQSEAIPENEDRSYAKHTRMELRHDSDYIIVGETRDEETANQLNILAETGHCVITTLHTSSALQAFIRMESLYPKESKKKNLHTLAEQLKVIIHQQLVPCLCSLCSKPTEAGSYYTKEQLDVFGIGAEELVYHPNKNGCPSCENSSRPGYNGRIMVAEAIVMPETESKKIEFMRILEEQSWSKIKENKNDLVEYYKRSDSLRHYIKSGQIDIHYALDLLGGEYHDLLGDNYNFFYQDEEEQE